MMNAAANTNPSQRPGLLKYRPGVSRGIAWALNSNASGANPSKRSFNIDAKCDVLKVIFSKKAIPSNGKTAQRNVARRTQPETSNAQP